MTRGSLSFALALLVAGCGGGAQMREAAPPAQPEGTEGRKPLTELDALEHDLSISEQRLEAQLVRREEALADSRDRDGEAESLKKKAESPEPSAAEERDEAPAAEEKPRAGAPAPRAPEPDEAPAKTAKVGSPCDMACRALSSMRRSAERICALAGGADERCMRARGRVSAAEERIRRAQCECVNGGSDRLNARRECKSRPCRQDPGFESCERGKLTLTGSLDGSATTISENVFTRRDDGDELAHVFLDRAGALVFMPAPPGQAATFARLIVPNGRGETLCVGDAVATPDAARERFSLRLGSLSRLQNRCHDVPAPGSIDICL